MEDVPTADANLPGKLNAEDILSVNEQVTNVRDFKNEGAADKIYKMLSKALNPFMDANFNA